MVRTRNTLLPRKLPTIFVAALAVSVLPGCMATLTGAPSYVGSDPSDRSVHQATLREGGGYFVFENGSRAFLRDRQGACIQAKPPLERSRLRGILALSLRCGGPLHGQAGAYGALDTIGRIRDRESGNRKCSR